MTLILTRSEVLALLVLPEVIDAVRHAHADLARGDAVLPAPPAMRLTGTDSRFLAMAALSRRAGLAAVKLLADMPGNREYGLPAQRSAILTVATDDGSCDALIDGAAVTRFRTAAASAVATAELARPDSRVLGLVGAGALAHTHLEALRAVHDFDKVLVWSRSTVTARAFATGTGVDVADSVEQVVRTADVLCTLTPAKEPVVQGKWFELGLHVNAVGAPPRPDHREIDTEGIRRAKVVVDSRLTALSESGDVLIPLREGAIAHADIDTEIGEVVAGTKPGRTGADQITLYNSLGVGLQDLAAARLLVDAARKQGIGTEIDLGA
ncbi:ornithine cyclodeaminase family protein [Nocardia puris]|uniref:Ornithine cyclodeaminase/alanine dehydrogenase n=1 Tax=Nocardia puris TaxID=208602 RepID=A0A366DV32_9NOCA|nr:ornithine cyclodeaminase family protein [Nocardia puris]MBF6210534.1 ornithine cyclodeaminase family protein [Nocardia puris]MBF6369259.1 ornithine cyclodeaminase family protein [Nocardia puris]MBF6457794.1 ornithine cyclodeaminase family protein [Nocardia puris]RBO93961.1 ornithine cyclodeaminase/alanine dehydrogenase [Nocardia puris]